VRKDGGNTGKTEFQNGDFVPQSGGGKNGKKKVKGAREAGGEIMALSY